MTLYTNICDYSFTQTKYACRFAVYAFRKNNNSYMKV